MASCGETEYISLQPEIPRELTTEVTVAPRDGGGLKTINLVIIDLTEAVATANKKLTAIACIAHPEEVEDPRACRTKGSDR